MELVDRLVPETLVIFWCGSTTNGVCICMWDERIKHSFQSFFRKIQHQPLLCFTNNDIYDIHPIYTLARFSPQLPRTLQGAPGIITPYPIWPPNTTKNGLHFWTVFRFPIEARVKITLARLACQCCYKGLTIIINSVFARSAKPKVKLFEYKIKWNMQKDVQKRGGAASKVGSCKVGTCVSKMTG